MTTVSESDHDTSIRTNALIDRLLSWKREDWKEAQIKVQTVISPGQAHLQNSVLEKLTTQMKATPLPNVHIRAGSLKINDATRNCLFICQELGNNSIVIMAVHIGANGNDLLVSWIEAGFEVFFFRTWLRLLFVLLGLICFYPFFFLIVPIWWGYLLLKWASTGIKVNKGSNIFTGVQVDEAVAFREAVINSLWAILIELGVSIDSIQVVSTTLYTGTIRAMREDPSSDSTNDNGIEVPNPPRPIPEPDEEATEENALKISVISASEPELLQVIRQTLFLFREANWNRTRNEKRAHRQFNTTQETIESTIRDNKQGADQLLEETQQAYREGSKQLDKVNLHHLMPNPQNLTFPDSPDYDSLENSLSESATKTKIASTKVTEGVKDLINSRRKRKLTRIAILMLVLLLLTAAFLGYPYLRINSSGAKIISGGYSRRQTTDLALSPDGETLVSALSDGRVRLRRVSDGVLLRTFRWHTSAVITSMAFAPEGEILAFASSNATVVELWQTNGVLLSTLRGHTSGVTNVVFAPDGGTLASASSDGTVRLWQVSNGVQLHTLRGHTSGVTSVTFAPDGETLASASSDGTVWLWEVPNGTLLHTLQGNTSAITSVAFAPNGETLASASSDGTVRLWHRTDETLLHILKGHDSAVTSIAFAPDGGVLASTSSDGTVRLWRVANGDPLQVLDLGYGFDNDNLAFLPANKGLIASTAWLVIGSYWILVWPNVN